MKSKKIQSLLLASALIVGLVSVPTAAHASPTGKPAFWSLYQGKATGAQVEPGKTPVILGPDGRPVPEPNPAKIGKSRVTKTAPGKRITKDDAARAKLWETRLTSAPNTKTSASTKKSSGTSATPQDLPDSLNGPQPYETLSPDYCRWWGDDPQTLYVYSHLYECTGGLVDAQAFSPQGMVIGHVWLRVWTYGVAWSANPNYTWAPTQVIYRQSWILDHREGNTEGFENVSFQLGTRCRPDELHSTCTTTGPTIVSGALMALSDDSDPVTVEEDVTFSPSYFYADDLDFSRIYFRSTQYASIVSAGAAVRLLDFGEDRVRCDSGYSIEHLKQYFSEGCIFDIEGGLISHYTRLDVSNEAIMYSAQHVVDALNSNNDSSVVIYPPRTGLRVIPGDPDHPLTRGYERVESQDVVATCQTYFPNYAAQDKDCDEYAFASTEQGAANILYDFSARAIPSSDNRASGSYLGWWYATERILPTVDQFDVFVTVPCYSCACMVC